MNNPIGIMQGRLSPPCNGQFQSFPLERWKQEFHIAKSLDFECIEFIFDYENLINNPLMTEKGLSEIRTIVKSTGVKVHSVCADYFMKFRFFNNEEAQRINCIKVLKKLIEGASSIGVTDITIPCVDESSLKNETEIEELKKSLNECLQVADSYNVNINLETDLSPIKFHKLITEINHTRIKVNYDIGNSASLGYDPEEEIETYGKYISVLHVKDRLHKGGSVKLGTGDAHFDLVFKRLKQIDFTGIIIMQAARSQKDIDEIKFVKEQFIFLRNSLKSWFYNGS